MYVQNRTRMNRTGEIIYYFYNCVSYRENGKVKTKQDYILKLEEKKLKRNYLNTKELKSLRKTDIKTWIRLIVKIEEGIKCKYKKNDILYLQ